MKKENLIKLSAEMLNNDSKIHFSNFKKLLDLFLCLFVHRIENGRTVFNKDRLYFINLLSQKFLVHGFSIKKLTNGIILDSPSKNISMKMYDPFSIHTLTRTIIENYLVQNYLSNSREEEDLLQCRFEIWMRYGILQRNIEPESEEEKRVTEIDIKSIKRLEESIKKRDAYLKLSDDKKISFLKTINKEWKILFDNDKFYPISWKRLMKEAGIKEGVNNQVYNFLSWHSHSQSISILQLEKMWNKNFDKKSILISIKKLNMFIGFMCSDIIKSDINFKNAYDNLEEPFKDLINFYNLTYRSANYMIEQLKN